MNEQVVQHWEPRSINLDSSAVRQLGDALYNLRLRAGLTQQALADLSGGLALGPHRSLAHARDFDERLASLVSARGEP